MFKRTIFAAVVSAAMVASASAQTPAPAEVKNPTHEITVTVADTVYTGVVALKVERGKVSGDMLITAPTEITGKVAGTSKDDVLMLEFPYHMTQNMCTGTVKMNIKRPAKPGVATGTIEAKGCADDPNQALPGTVELKPIASRPTK